MRILRFEQVCILEIHDFEDSDRCPDGRTPENSSRQYKTPKYLLQESLNVSLVVARCQRSANLLPSASHANHNGRPWIVREITYIRFIRSCAVTILPPITCYV